MTTTECNGVINDGGTEDNGTSSSNSTTLCLTSQDLLEIPDYLFQPSYHSLTSLDLSRNRLPDLPVVLFESLPQLQVLNVNRNRLRVLPPEIGRLKQLRELRLLANKLRPHARSLPLKELSQLTCLEVLDLRYNEKLKQPALQALKEALVDSVEIKITTTTQQPEQPDQQSTSTKLHACDRDATLLQSQLEPLSSPTLRRRLQDDFGMILPEEDAKSFDRDYVMTRLLQAYQEHCPQGRERVDYTGRPIPPTLIEELLQELHQWVQQQDQKRTPRERPTIRASHYMILRSPEEFSTQHSTKQRLAQAKLQKHERLWNLAKAALDTVLQGSNDPFTFTALAVTHNFVGSPHIDTQNVGPFYAIALGDFTKGGELCVELNATQVAYVDTHNKFGKLDGRFVHWVAPYEEQQENRYSLIYYQTVGEVTPMTTAVLPVPEPAASPTLASSS